MTYPLATLPPLLVSDSLFLWAYLLRSPLSGAGEERPPRSCPKSGCVFESRRVMVFGPCHANLQVPLHLEFGARLDEQAMSTVQWSLRW